MGRSGSGFCRVFLIRLIVGFLKMGGTVGRVERDSCVLVVGRAPNGFHLQLIYQSKVTLEV